MSVEVMKQALDALEVWKDSLSDEAAVPAWRFSIVGDPAITALRDAIAEAAMQRLTDVQQAIETAVADQATYGMGITLGGKRIDPASIYKEPEPVAWIDEHGNIDRGWDAALQPNGWQPIYTHPPRREWVELTDEAILLEYQTLWPFYPKEEPRLAGDIIKFARAIEAKLKEKNHG
jgi:hypothetical protein